MMTLPRRIPLSPCDYLVYSHHRLMRRRRQGEYVAMMVLDAAGDIAPERVRHALAGALAAHPIMMSDVVVPAWRGRPCWQLPVQPAEAAERAAERAHSREDLRDSADWAARVEQLTAQRLAHRWTIATGPQIRLDQYALPEGRTRFCLRWPHFLMDADGAQLFLREIDRFDGSDPAAAGGEAQALPPDVLPDHCPVDVLAGRSFGERLRLLRRSFVEVRSERKLVIRGLQPGLFPASTEHGLLHRSWTPEQVQRLHAKAKATIPAGTALYTRYLAVCAMRALHRIFGEQGVDTDAYQLALPVHVTLPGESKEGGRARPVCGNYLVALTLCGARAQAADKAALGGALLGQFESFAQNHADLSFWAMMWAASRLRAWTYQLLFDLRLGFVPLASGFSYYGELARPVHTFCGVPVTNLWGAGLAATPPGWNLAISRFADRLNLTLTYNQPAVSPELARQYLDYFEEEAFAAG